MSLGGEPHRWSEPASDAPEGLREMLLSARNDLPSEPALLALGVVVPTLTVLGNAGTASAASAKLGAAQAGAQGTSVGLATGVAASAKLAATGLVVALLGTASYAVVSEQATPVARATSGLGTTLVSDLEGLELPPVAAARPSLEPGPSASAMQANAEAPRGTAAATPGKRSPAAEAEELQLLRTARANLRSAPTSALELVRRHEREYPKTRYQEERAVIRIEALRQLGRRDEAAEEGRRFKERFPESAHRSRLESNP